MEFMRLAVRGIVALCSVAIFVLIVIICYEVFVRFALGMPTSWVIEISSYLFVWLSLLSAAIAIADDRQLRIDFLVNLLKGRGRAVAEVVTLLVMLAMIVLSVVLGVSYFQEAYASGWAHSWGRLGVPMVYTRSALPVVGTIIVVFLLLKIYIELRRAAGLEPDRAPEPASVETDIL